MTENCNYIKKRNILQETVAQGTLNDEKIANTNIFGP